MVDLGTIISSLKDNEVKDYLKKHNITEDDLKQLKTVLYKIGETFYIIEDNCEGFPKDVYLTR